MNFTQIKLFAGDLDLALLCWCRNEYVRIQCYSRQRPLTVIHITFGGADQELGCVLISFYLLVC